MVLTRCRVARRACVVVTLLIVATTTLVHHAGSDGAAVPGARALAGTESPRLGRRALAQSQEDDKAADAVANERYLGTDAPVLVSTADANDPNVIVVAHPSSLTVTKSMRLCTDMAPAVGRRGVLLVIGISTVRRPTTQYVFGAIGSLISHVGDDEANVLILVQLADEREDDVQRTLTTLRGMFANAIRSGLLEIVRPLPESYPALTGLKRNFNDADDRVRWRSKQCVDFGHIMALGSTRGQYYMQLEDDMFAMHQYTRRILLYVRRLEAQGTRWTGLNVHSSGFTAKLFHAADAAELAVLFKTFYSEKPVDFIIGDFISLKVGSLRSQKPSPFSHMGIESSLPGQKRAVM